MIWSSPTRRTTALRAKIRQLDDEVASAAVLLAEADSTRAQVEVLREREVVGAAALLAEADSTIVTLREQVAAHAATVADLTAKLEAKNRKAAGKEKP